MRLDLRMVDFGAADLLLAHEIGRGKARAHVAERVMDFALEIARLVVVQQHGARRARRRRRVIGGQLLHLEFDQVERALGGLRVDRGHRGDRLAAIAHAPARERIFVHGDRQHAVSVRAVVAGHHREHAVERARLADVEPDDLAVADRAAEDAADQRVGMVEIGGIAGAAGDLLDAVDQRNAAARFLTLTWSAAVVMTPAPRRP